jgi:hypothetical protein
VKSSGSNRLQIPPGLRKSGIRFRADAGAGEHHHAFGRHDHAGNGPDLFVQMDVGHGRLLHSPLMSYRYTILRKKTKRKPA